MYEVYDIRSNQAVITCKRECDAMDFVSRKNDKESDYVWSYREV